MNTFLEVSFLYLVFETFSFGELLSELLEDRLTLRACTFKHAFKSTTMVPIAIRVGIIRTIIRVVICNRIIFLCGYIIGTTTAATSATPTIATYATTSICGIASCLQCFTFASQTTMSFATFGQALHIDIFNLG